MKITIREMNITDYDQVYGIWESIPGMKLEEADSRNGVQRYLQRNPKLSFVAEINTEIIGTVLCGEDGRRGYLQHLCVKEPYRKIGIAKKLVNNALKQFEALNLHEIRIFIFKDNDVGNEFWDKLGWIIRDDIFIRSLEINK